MQLTDTNTTYFFQNVLLIAKHPAVAVKAENNVEQYDFKLQAVQYFGGGRVLDGGGHCRGHGRNSARTDIQHGCVC